MKVFEQRQQNGSRKLMGTKTNDVTNAVEVALKSADGNVETTFDFSKQYHYVAPGAMAINGTDTALGMYIDDLRVVPPITTPFEDTEESGEDSESSDDEDSDSPSGEEEITLYALSVDPPTKRNYVSGEPIDLTGMVVKLIYSDDSEEVITTGYTTDPEDGELASTLKGNIIVTHTESGKVVYIPIDVTLATITRTVDMNGGTAYGEAICIDQVMKGLDWVPDLWYSQTHSTWTIPEGKAWNGVSTVKNDESTKITHMVLDSDCTFYVLWKDA